MGRIFLHFLRGAVEGEVCFESWDINPKADYSTAVSSRAK
jgi:hypothetical protein